MKVVITNDSLDSLLSVQISTNSGQSYSTYSVSSLKDGLTFDCSSKDLKVICDVNTLKYIQVLADGEKASSSDIDLSNYIKIKDIYVDVYINPYYEKDLTEEEARNLTSLESALYEHRQCLYYCHGEGFEPSYWNEALTLVRPSSNNKVYGKDDFYDILTISDDTTIYYYYAFHYGFDERFLDCDLRVKNSRGYLNDIGSFFTNARVHFIKHF